METTTNNILIIGATSGIGYRLWQHYVSEGHNVAVIGRRKEVLDKMQKDFPEQTFPICCDISDLSAINELFRNIPEIFSNIDIDTELSTVSVNVQGWTKMVATLYKLFERQQSGQLVALTSIGGLQPTPIAPSYSASKAFQINYIKALQKKSKNIPIIVTEIRPGLVDTRMAKGEGLFWVMPLDKVVPMIINAVSRKKKLQIVTTRWCLINWILRHLV